MISSMTGFGRGSSEVEDTTATVELRSVNKRFLEVHVSLPEGLTALEPKVERHIKQAFERGRFSVQVSLEQRSGDSLPMGFDEKTVASYARLLEALREASGVSAEVDLSHLLHFSEHFLQAEAAQHHEEAAWAAVRRALEEAIERLRAMRREEGRALEDDLQRHIDGLRETLHQVEARLPERLREAKARLEERLDELLDQRDLDEDRLAQEVAYLTDKLDISEECVRLASHTKLFEDALDTDEAVGRRLNFIVQEMHREVNTIGSKANDAEIARHAVTMKERIEKLREQIQNVE